MRNQHAGEVLPRIRHADGAYLIDDTGKRDLDGSGGPVLPCVGQGNREVMDEIKRQLDRFEFAFGPATFLSPENVYRPVGATLHRDDRRTGCDRVYRREFR